MRDRFITLADAIDDLARIVMPDGPTGRRIGGVQLGLKAAELADLIATAQHFADETRATMRELHRLEEIQRLAREAYCDAKGHQATVATREAYHEASRAVSAYREGHCI